MSAGGPFSVGRPFDLSNAKCLLLVKQIGFATILKPILTNKIIHLLTHQFCSLTNTVPIIVKAKLLLIKIELYVCENTGNFRTMNNRFGRSPRSKAWGFFGVSGHGLESSYQIQLVTNFSGFQCILLYYFRTNIP